jgi:2-dehydropantoate 2-reductase
MKVSVVGAGALGSLLGGLLKHYEPDLDVLLIGRGPHGAVLRQRGTLRLLGRWGEFKVPIRFSENLADAAGSDVILFTVKSHATEETIRTLAPHVGNATVVSIQNGINGRLLAPYVTSDRLVIGMFAGNVALTEPGTVSVQLAGVTLLGPPARGPLTPAVRQSAALLERTGMRVHAQSNTLGAQYNKLAVNALGYAAVLSRSNFITEGLLSRAWRRALGGPILKECLTVFGKAGIRMAPVPGVPDISSFRFFLFLFGVPIVGDIGGWIMRFFFNQKPIIFSLQRDLERRKPTEIEFINGEVVRLARELGLEAPRNARVVELVHELEQRGDGSFFSRDAVIHRFQMLKSLPGSRKSG